MTPFAAASAEWFRLADRYRTAVLAAVLLAAAAQAAGGLPIHPVVFVTLGAWLAVGLAAGAAMNRLRDPQQAAHWRVALFVADLIGVAAVEYASGAIGLVGALPYAFTIAFSAATLSEAAVLALTGLAVVVYGVPLFGVALGVLAPIPLAGAPAPPPTFGQAVAAWGGGAAFLAVLAHLTSTFVRHLRRTSGRYQLLFEEAPIIIANIDRAMCISTINPAGAAAIGGTPDALVGASALDWVPDEDRAEIRARIEAAFAGRPQGYVARLRRAGGGVLWADVALRPVYDGADPHDAHAATGVLALVRDVTEERAASAALTAREARFRALVQHSSDTITVTAADGRILYVSPSLRAQFGHDPESRIGHSVQEFIHPDDVPEFVEAFRATADEPIMRRYRVRRADGAWRQVESVCRDLRDEPAVGGFVFNTRDVTERAELEAALVRQAYHDALTGLANRAYFGDRLDEALARAETAGNPARVAVLVLDLDGFKAVNDSLGHAAGDALLVEVAARLLQATRGGDVVARLGGDEFAVLLERVQEDGDAAAVAERVLAALESPFTVGGRRTAVGVSVGIARGGTTNEEAEGAPALLRNADVAMYEAKARGKGRWVLFEPAMHAAAVERVALEGDLRGALERGEFCLSYQPIVSLATGRAAGVEALVRWQRPGRGLVRPAEFIGVAEATGLVVPLGRWVLGEACRRAAEWQGAGWEGAEPGAPFDMAVNVSAQELEHADFVAHVAEALHDAGLAPEALTLEITEHSMVRDPDLARAVLTSLRALGVRVAIDDFGTGYSALSQVQQFPLDVLKLDRAFVAQLGAGGSPAAVTRTLVALGGALSARVVAEGIETEAQRDALAALGCPLGQGFLFAHPLAPEAVAEWVLASASGNAASGVALGG